MANELVPVPLEIDDFSGGMTDFYISGPLNKFQLAENFILEKYGVKGKPKTRPGCAIQDEDLPRIPANARVSDLIYFEGEQFHYYGQNIYYRGVTWTTLQGPAGNPVFKSGSATSYMSSAEWNKNLLVSNDALSHVQKVYKDETSTWRVRELGLPSLDLSGAIVLANDLKSKFNAHIADTSEHTAGADTAHAITSADATDFDSLVTLINDLLVNYDAHEGDAELSSAWAYHAAQEGDDHSLESSAAPTSLLECIDRLTDLKAKFNGHDADGDAHGTDSSHQSSADYQPTVSAGGNTGKTYLYAFHYAHRYQVGSVTFRESGPVKVIELTDADAPDSKANTITKIPAISNGSTRNYATSEIVVEIYRTVNNGTTFYYVGEVTNGTSSYTDGASDTTIQTRGQTIYTDGGVLDNTPPPQCKYIVHNAGVVYYMNVKEEGSMRPSRFLMSKPDAPYAAPFREDIDDEILGGAVAQGNTIMFSKSGRIFRIEGTYDSSGRGTVRKREIARTVVLASERSIVQILNGVVFAARDGFYFTDGFVVRKISESIPETYKSLVSTDARAAKIFGTYDSLRNRVYWSCHAGPISADNDVIFVAHFDWGVRPDTPFTTWTGTWSATSMVFRDNLLIVGDSRGYTFEFNEETKTDPDIDTSSAATDWNTETIIYDLRSCAFDFGSTQVRKWVPKIIVTANNESSLALQIYSNNDNSGTFIPLSEIVYNGNIAWGDQRIEWGSQDVRWDYLPIIDAWRHFPARGLRCSYKQVRFTNAYTIIDDSASNEVATVDATAKTVTLANNNWVQDAENYFISFEDDDYLKEYLVTDRTNSVLTYSDVDNTSVSGAGKAWRLRGYPKTEVFNLISYVINFNYLTTTQSKFERSR